MDGEILNVLVLVLCFISCPCYFMFFPDIFPHDSFFLMSHLIYFHPIFTSFISHDFLMSHVISLYRIVIFPHDFSSWFISFYVFFHLFLCSGHFLPSIIYFFSHVSYFTRLSLMLIWGQICANSRTFHIYLITILRLLLNCVSLIY